MLKTSNQIKYTGGYKYQLRERAIFRTTICPDKNIKAELVELKMDGTLIIEKYFAWDGASSLAIDCRTNMRGSLCHDALYYLMRIGKLDSKWRLVADKMLYNLMIKDGSCKIRAKYYEWAVNNFAKSCSEPKNARKIITAP